MTTSRYRLDLKAVVNEIKEIRNELKSGFGSTWNVVKKLEKLKKNNRFQFIDEYRDATFKVFIKDHFNFTEFKYMKCLKLMEKYTKEDFDKLGPDTLFKIETYCKVPEHAFKRIKLQIKRDKGIVSNAIITKILGEEKQENKSKKKLSPHQIAFFLEKELGIWVNMKLVTPKNAKTIGKQYGLKMVRD